MTLRPLVALLVLAAPLAAEAESEPLPMRAADFTAPKAMALGDAFRANGTTNDALFFNPAALGVTPRYGFEGQALHDFNHGLDSYGLSIVDSSAGPVTAGVSANRLILGQESERTTANLFHLGLAAGLSDNILLGVSGKLLHTHEADGGHNRITPDVGLLLRLEPVALGLVAYNLVNVHSAQLPRQYAIALSFGLPLGLHAEGDVVLDTDSHPDVSASYHAGVEYEVMPFLALRGGYLEDRIRYQRSVSGGFGILVPPGFGVDLAYRHELLGATPARVVAVALNVAF